MQVGELRRAFDERARVVFARLDDAFVAEVPELPGCMADGPSYADALANAEIIIQDWIETAQKLNREIPEAKGRLKYA